MRRLESRRSSPSRSRKVGRLNMKNCPVAGHTHPSHSFFLFILLHNLALCLALVCFRYFADHKNKKTSWIDPRFGPKDPHFLSYEDPIVEVVFDILISAFSVTFKQQKDSWKLWEEAFGIINFPLVSCVFSSHVSSTRYFLSKRSFPLMGRSFTSLGRKSDGEFTHGCWSSPPLSSTSGEQTFTSTTAPKTPFSRTKKIWCFPRMPFG